MAGLFSLEYSSSCPLREGRRLRELSLGERHASSASFCPEGGGPGTSGVFSLSVSLGGRSINRISSLTFRFSFVLYFPSCMAVDVRGW